MRTVRAQTFVPGENPNTSNLIHDFTGLDKKVYANFLKLQEADPAEGTKDWRRLQKLKQAVYNETQRLIRDRRNTEMKNTLEQRVSCEGYDPFSSSEEEVRRRFYVMLILIIHRRNF